MIVFDNWVIRMERAVPVRQFDNRVETLNITGNVPEDWEWNLLVRNGKNMDIFPLERVDGGIGVVLTEQRLAGSGFYWLQLRGKKGELVRHTNMVRFYVEPSLSGDVQWPVVPGEFSAMERRICEKVAWVEGYAAHPPVVGENETWWVWNGAGYVDTGKPSRGEAYELSEADKRVLVDAVLTAIPDGDEVSY